MDNKEIVRWICIISIAALLSTCKPIDIDYIDKREVVSGANNKDN